MLAMNLERPISFKEAYVDGCNYLCFIVYALAHKHVVVYALSNEHETHQSIREYAEEMNVSLAEHEPVGGGVFNADTGYYERGSFSFGNPEPPIIDAVSTKMEDIVARRECR